MRGWQQQEELKNKLLLVIKVFVGGGVGDTLHFKGEDVVTPLFIASVLVAAVAYDAGLPNHLISGQSARLIREDILNLSQLLVHARRVRFASPSYEIYL